MCLSLIKSIQITCLSPDFSRLRVLLSNSKEINFKELGPKDKDLVNSAKLNLPSFFEGGPLFGDTPNQASTVNRHMQRLSDNSMEKMSVAVSPLHT